MKCRKTVLSVLLNIAAVLAVFMLAEALAERFYHPLPQPKVRANSVTFWRTDKISFPGANPFPRNGHKLKIVCLGDSNVAGSPGPMDMAWPAHLEAALRRRGIDAVVGNGGCPGFTTWQTAEVFKEYCRRYSPDDDALLIHCLFNDAMLEPVTDRQRQRILAESRAMREGLARFALYQWLKAKLLRPVVVNQGRVPRVPPVEFVENLALMRAVAERHGIGLQFVSLPVTRPEGVAYRSRLPALPVPIIELGGNTSIKARLLEDGVHFDGEGQRLIGEAIAAKLGGGE